MSCCVEMRQDTATRCYSCGQRPANENLRRHNGRSCSEVAALVPGNEDSVIPKPRHYSERRGTANANGNEVLHKVKISHRSYDPVSYVILFPDGRDGWYLGMQFQAGSRQRKLLPLMFYSWHIFQRRDKFTTVLSGFLLFQLYLVDQFCKMEAVKMHYLLKNQQCIRAEKYTALRELLGNSGGLNDESEAVRSGRLLVLPSTHIGSELYMRQKMHDIIRSGIPTYS